MIQVHTMVAVVDNSGVVFGRCIRLLRGCQKDKAYIGNFIVLTVQKTILNKGNKKNKVKKSIKTGDIYKGIVVSINKNITRLNSIYLKSNKNSVILVGDNFLPLGSRISSPVFLELRTLKLLKLLSIANIVF